MGSPCKRADLARQACKRLSRSIVIAILIGGSDMTTTLNIDKAHLEATAKATAEQLRGQRHGRPLSLHRPHTLKAGRTDTKGWSVEIGRITGGGPGLELWLDLYTSHSQPKFYACFYSTRAATIDTMVRHAPPDWKPGQWTDADMREGRLYVQKKRLPAGEFNRPIVEHYSKHGHHFFGFY